MGLLDGMSARFKKIHDTVHPSYHQKQVNIVDYALVQEFNATILDDLLKKYDPNDLYNCNQARVLNLAISKKTLAYVCTTDLYKMNWTRLSQIEDSFKKHGQRGL